MQLELVVRLFDSTKIYAFCILGFSLIYFTPLSAQDVTEKYRPKIAEFGVETIWDYHTDYSSERLGTTYKDEVESDILLKFKIAAPLIMKENKLFGLQLKYYEHRFDFDFENQPVDDELFLHLDTRKIKNAGLRLFYQSKMDNNRKITLAGGAEFKSDQFTWNVNTTKYFISALHKWKINQKKDISVGAVVNYDLGLLNAYPVFIYENQINQNWALELSLPKSVSIRRKLNSSNYLIAKTQFKGWRYNLTGALTNENEDLTIRRADLLMTISWERELHDWLWFGIDVGYIKNLRYYLSEPGGRRRDALVDINSQDARYIKASLFIVPPRKFYK